MTMVSVVVPVYFNAPSLPAPSTLPRQRAASWIAENGALVAIGGGIAIVLLLAFMILGLSAIRHWHGQSRQTSPNSPV